MIWVALLGTAAGVLFGLFVKLPLAPVYAKYLGIGILAALDSIIGGLRAYYEHVFDEWIFLSGFVSNAIIAAILAYIGDRIGVEIYLAVLFVFGARVFQNIAVLRRRILQAWQARGQ